MKLASPITTLLVLALFITANSVYAQEDDALSVQQQHAKDKIELQKIKEELGGVKSEMNDARQGMSQVEQQLSRPKIKEFNLIANEGSWELFSGTSVACLAYSGQVPGPTIRVQEGDAVRIVLHNQMKSPTSLQFHGLKLPHGVSGLPRQGAGLIGPGQAYAYQFIASQPGTYWYHPQVSHAEQLARGLYGALIVEPAQRSYNRDEVMILGQWPVVPAVREPVSKEGRAVKSTISKLPPVSASASDMPPHTVTYFTINGKCAPAIPVLEVHQGDRVRLRIINAAQQPCPLYLSGHKLEIVSANGDPEARASRDTLSVGAGERYDVEFTADNPGVWSLSSLIAQQTTNNGKFPGGIACVVRYVEKK